MDYFRILRRAFDMTRFYPALWVFGFLLALTAGGGGSGSGWRNQYHVTPGAVPFPSTPQIWNALAGVGIGLACVFLVIGLVFAILRYVSDVALMRMANGYDASGQKVSVGTGFHLGWSQAAWRVFLLDLLFGLAFIVVLAVLVLLAAAPLLLLTAHNNALSVIGVVIAVGLGLLFLAALIVAGYAAYLVNQVSRRAVALEGLGVIDGLRRGWGVVRRRLSEVVVMGLIMLAIGLAFGLLMIPVAFILALIGGVAGGIPGLLAGAVTSLFTRGAAPTIVGILVGLPLFLVVLVIPLALIGSLYQTFSSSVWTLTFRDLVALEGSNLVPASPVTPEPLPEGGI